MNRIMAALERELEDKDCVIAELRNLLDHRDLEHEATRKKLEAKEQTLFDANIERDTALREAGALLRALKSETDLIRSTSWWNKVHAFLAVEAQS